MRKDKKNAKMEVRQCKNKNCQFPLPEGYKYKYCENCRNNQANLAKKGVKGAAALLFSAGLFVISKGKFGGKDA